MKIAVIGGGSTYTPELVSGLSRLDVSQLARHQVVVEEVHGNIVHTVSRC